MYRESIQAGPPFALDTYIFASLSSSLQVIVILNVFLWHFTYQHTHTLAYLCIYLCYADSFRSVQRIYSFFQPLRGRIILIDAFSCTGQVPSGRKTSLKYQPYTVFAKYQGSRSHGFLRIFDQ